MSARWLAEDLAAFEERRRRYEETGTVRTHKIDAGVTEAREPLKKRASIVLRLSERQVLRACLNALRVHPKIAFAWRQNVGALHDNSRVVRFAFKGCSDIIGCLKGGRWLAVECKATGERANDNQATFLKRVNEAGGLGICVDDPSKLLQALESA